MFAILFDIVKLLPWRQAAIALLMVFLTVSLSPGAAPDNALSYSKCVTLLEKLEKDPGSPREEWSKAIQAFLSINKTEKNRGVAGNSLFFAGKATLELYRRWGKPEDLNSAVRYLSEFTRDHRKDRHFIEGLKALKEADTLRQRREQLSHDRRPSIHLGAAPGKAAPVSVPQNSGLATPQKSQQPVVSTASQSNVGGNWSSPAYRHAGNPFWTPRNRNRGVNAVRPISTTGLPAVTETTVSTSVSVTSPASQTANTTPDNKQPAGTIAARPPLPIPQISAQSPRPKEPLKEAPAAPAQNKLASVAPSAKPPQEPEKREECTAKNYVVVLDPGHGGRDPGAVSQDGTLKEKDITLEVAKATKKNLEKTNPGITVELTRSEDKFMSLEARTGFANRLNADLFISIHCNSDTDSSSAGIETYYLSQANSEKAMKVAATENNLSLAKMSDLQATLLDLMVSSKKTESEELATAVSNSLEQVIPKGRHRGVKQAPFYVLLGAKMPAILVECAFISSTRESKKLHSSEYLNIIAQGLANGAHSYVQGLGTSGGDSLQSTGQTAKLSR
jgi:N-acetylmuramoyl-L-alanine amidase